MKHAIISTVGPAGNGRTTLVRALAQGEAARVGERRDPSAKFDNRSTTLRLPDGTIAHVLDAPSEPESAHGPMGSLWVSDVALIVIAADQSDPPSLGPLLDALYLLDIKSAVVALTKRDAVDAAQAMRAEEQIRSALRGSALARTPIAQVSAVRTKGIAALKRALMAAASRAPNRNTSVPFRFAIDATSSAQGSEALLCGSLIAGLLRVGEPAVVAPQGLVVRVTRLYVDGARVKVAQAGTRVAVSVAGERAAEILPLSQLGASGTLCTTQRLDVLFAAPTATDELLDDEQPVQLWLGSAVAAGACRILDHRTRVLQGAQAFIQIELDEPIPCVKGDRFLVRPASGRGLLGSAVVIDTAPATHGKSDEAILDALAKGATGGPKHLVETALLSRASGVHTSELVAASGVAEHDALEAIEQLSAADAAVTLPFGRVIHTIALIALTGRVEEALTAYHRRYPQRAGMPEKELRHATGVDPGEPAFASVLARWSFERRIVMEGSHVRLQGFQPELSERQQSLLTRIERVYRDRFISIPPIGAVATEVQAPPDAILALLRLGVEHHRFVVVNEGGYYHVEAVSTLKQMIRDHLATDGPITVAALRDLTGSNREFAMIALEYLDGVGYTRREGDAHVLVGADERSQGRSE